MAFALFLLFEVYYISLDRPYSGLNWFDVILITINILILVSTIKSANTVDYYQNAEEGRQEWQEAERKKNVTPFEKFREEQEALLKKEEEKKKEGW